MPVPVTINYTNRDFEQMVAELTGFIQATRAEDQNDFFESSLGTMLVELAAYVGDILSFGQDSMAQELFLTTMRRYESAIRFARSVGYVPRSAVSASVFLVAQTLPPNIVTNGAIIRAGSSVQGLNGLPYEIVTDQVIPPGAANARLRVNEGRTFREEYSPTRAANQSFFSQRAIVEDGSWSVFVGDADNPVNEWTQVDTVAFETGPTNTYQVAFDGEGRVQIFFGDGNAGGIPNQVVTLVYRTTEGQSGNTALNTVRGAIQAELLGGLGTAALDVANSESAATGGVDRESIEDLRLSIPAFLRSLDKVITLRDYEESLVRIAGVDLVFADTPLSSYQGNIVRVHAWATELIDFQSTSLTSGITSQVTYRRYLQLPNSQLSNIQSYLTPRTLATIQNIGIRPTIANVDMELGIVNFDKRFNRTDVHRDIVRAVVSVFEAATGFSIRIADLYDAILGVEGVNHFNIERIVFEHIDPLNPPAVIIEQFRRDQDPFGVDGGPYNPIQDVIIEGAENRVFYNDAFLYDNEILYDSDIESSGIQAINLRSLVFDLQA